MKSFTTKITKFAAITAAVIFSLIAAASTTALAQEAEGISFDGLKPVDDPAVYMAYIDPEADFSVFKRVMILDPFVSFTSNWQRDQNRNRRRNVRASDMERIKTDTANLFRDVFTEQLEAAGYEIVHQADYDVLLLRPAIIDLNISAPDIRTASRSPLHLQPRPERPRFTSNCSIQSAVRLSVARPTERQPATQQACPGVTA